MSLRIYICRLGCVDVAMMLKLNICHFGFRVVVLALVVAVKVVNRSVLLWILEILVRELH